MTPSLLVTWLALCIRGALGKGTLCTYPSLRVQHTLSEYYDSALLVSTRENYPCVNTTVWLWRGVNLCDVCSGNLIDFPFRGANLGCTYLCNFIPHPKEYHFHWTQMLSFDWIICYTDRGDIIAMYRCFWLRVSHFFQCESENYAHLAIVV